MGKTILCASNITKEAFLFPLTNTKIYSIEELCYYIYNNIYTLSEINFTTDLAEWIEKNLMMPVIATKIKKMIRKRESLKDIVVTILCSADYYEEDEIKSLIRIMDKLEKCSSLERTKLRADSLLKNQDFKNAAVLYYSILEESNKKTISDVFIGNVFHNLGIVKMQSSSYMGACEWFKKAYDKNQDQDSYKAYILSLTFAKKDFSLLNESKNYDIDSDIVNGILSEIDTKMEEAISIDEYRRMDQIKNLQEEGRLDEFYEKIEQMITKWKDEYKNGLI